MENIINRTVLITGTTSGIGYELSKVFAAHGYNLVLVSRNDEKLKKQKAELEKKYQVGIYTISKNLADSQAPPEIVAELEKKGVHIDILINNAGFNEAGFFSETDLEAELNMIKVHIMALTHLTKLLLPGMINHKYGKIINLGSTGSFTPCPLDAVYGAAKAYILSFSSALRAELAGTGVSVSTLCPGATRTEFAQKAKMENTLLFRYFVMEPSTVARVAYKAIMKGKKIIIPGFYNKLLVKSVPIIPAAMLNQTSIMLMTRR